MALLSRSSLRGSVRRAPDLHSSDGLEPPMKRQRTTQENGLRRRKSSPDCLDTTTPNESSSTGKPHPANPPPLKAARQRTSTRRARRTSASSVDSNASGDQLGTGEEGSRLIGNGVVKTPSGRGDREAVENVFASGLLRGARESPDPLDMISQSEISTTSTRTRPRALSGAARSQKNKSTDTPDTTTRATRRKDPGPTDGNIVNEEPHSDETRPAGPIRPQRKIKSDPVESEQHAPKRADGRRSLRSADTGSRCKSELAQYFYNYEQLISLEDPKPEFLSAATTITLIDDLEEPLPIPSTPDPTPFGNPLQELHNCEVIELSEPALRSSGNDPLNEELYFRAHRKFERQEKQLRNIERDRAQHEKQTVERLLEELRSHDWLRVMGLIGVHESEKKLYEPKRQILIQELVALVNKFQVWKDEERRRKLAKDRPPLLPTTADTEESRRSRKRSGPLEDDVDIESSPLPETPSTPDPNDVDAWAARQLHQEARSASSAAKRRKSVSEKTTTKPVVLGKLIDTANSAGTYKAAAGGKRQKTLHDFLVSSSSSSSAAAAPAASSTSTGSPQPAEPSSVESPEPAALAPETLWGYSTDPIPGFNLSFPDLQRCEFKPPPDILTPEAIRGAQRRRRRMKRQSAAG